MADRTVAYAQGRIADAEFEAAPGIERVWMQWLANIAAINTSPDDLRRVDQLTR